MWESTSYDNAGGFYEPTQGAQTPGGGEKKRQRAQNLVAVKIRDILDVTGECSIESSFDTERSET